MNKIIHLFSVSSVGNMIWSDGGNLSYFINIDDLEDMCFDNLFVEIESS